MKDLTLDEISFARAFAEFRMNLRQILHDHGIPSNPGWSEDDILQAIKTLIGPPKWKTNWKTPVVVYFNTPDTARRMSYMGCDTLKAYQITGVITGVLFQSKISGTVVVEDADGKEVFKETWENGNEVQS